MVRTVESPGRSRSDGDRPDIGTVTPLGGNRQRRPTFVLVGVLLVALAALGGALLVGSLTTTVAVLVAADDLVPGRVVTAADLRVVELSELTGAEVIPAGDQAAVVGRVARGPVPAGTVLHPGLFVEAAEAVPAGMAVVGASLDPGAAAGSGLRSGDRVDVLSAAPANLGGDASPEAGARILATGTVWSVEPPAAGSAGRIVVTVLVPDDRHPQVAQAAADDRLRLARVPG